MRISVWTSNSSFESANLCWYKKHFRTADQSPWRNGHYDHCKMHALKLLIFNMCFRDLNIQDLSDGYILDRQAEKGTGTFLFKSACTFIWFLPKKRAILLKFQAKKNGHSQWKFNYFTSLLSKLCYLNFNHRAIFLFSFLRFHPRSLFPFPHAFIHLCYK